MTTHPQLSKALTESADHLVADFALIDFVRYLSEHLATVFDVPAVGVLMADEHDLFQYVAASTEQAELVNLFQIQASEGPGFDCFHGGEPVLNYDLSGAARRWPQFGTAAITAGFSSVHAIPMHLRERVIGAVSVLDSEVGRFGDADVRIIQGLVDVVSIAVLEACTVRRAESLSGQLQDALESRVTIEQAKGALSRMRGVNVDQSFALMRAYARANRRQLRDVAQAILTDPASVAPLTAVH